MKSIGVRWTGRLREETAEAGKAKVRVSEVSSTLNSWSWNYFPTFWEAMLNCEMVLAFFSSGRIGQRDVWEAKLVGEFLSRMKQCWVDHWIEMEATGMATLATAVAVSLWVVWEPWRRESWVPWPKWFCDCSAFRFNDAVRSTLFSSLLVKCLANCG